MMGSVPWLQWADSSAADYPYRAMHKLACQYGPVMSVALGEDVWVVLTGLDAIKEFSMLDEATHRPDMASLDEIYSIGGKPLGVIFPAGPLWREQRKFMARALRDLGAAGRAASLDEHVNEEAERCASRLLATAATSTDDRVENVQDAFNVPCLNVIWRLVCGRRFEEDDPQVAKLIDCLEAFTMEKAIGPIAGIKALKYIPPFKGIYAAIKGHMDFFKAFLVDFVMKEKETRDAEEEDRGYLDAFLRSVGTTIHSC